MGSATRTPTRIDMDEIILKSSYHHVLTDTTPQTLISQNKYGE